MAKRIDEILLGGIETLGLTISEAQIDQLLTYLTMMEKWNRTYNLTAIRDPERMVVEHLLDALTVVSFLPQTGYLLDVGAGGGIPGIIIAIMCPNLQTVLLDSNQKKSAFLRQMKIELGLTQMTVETKRVEAYHPPVLFDRIICRAFSTLSDFVTLTRHLRAENGCWLAMKGVYPEVEINALPSDCRLLSSQRLQVPGLEAERHLLTIGSVVDEC